MNFKKLKDTGITLEVIYFLLLVIIIYFLYCICNNINKEYFTISADIGKNHMSSTELENIHNGKCDGLLSIIIKNGIEGIIRPDDIVYLVNRCENFYGLEQKIKNQLINIAKTVNTKIV
jgi:hypothetical protein